MNLLDSRGTVYYCRAAWLWWMCTVSGRVPAAPWWPHSRRSNWRYFFSAHPSSIKLEVKVLCPPILHQIWGDFFLPTHPPSNFRWLSFAPPSSIKLEVIFFCPPFLPQGQQMSFFPNNQEFIWQQLLVSYMDVMCTGYVSWFCPFK